MQRLKGYRTVTFNVIMLIATLVTFCTGHDTTEEANTLTSNIDIIEAALTVIWTIGNIWLRAITNSPIFKKD